LNGGLEDVSPRAEIFVENVQRLGHDLLMFVVRQILNSDNSTK